MPPTQQLTVSSNEGTTVSILEFCQINGGVCGVISVRTYLRLTDQEFANLPIDVSVHEPLCLCPADMY